MFTHFRFTVCADRAVQKCVCGGGGSFLRNIMAKKSLYVFMLEKVHSCVLIWIKQICGGPIHWTVTGASILMGGPVRRSFWSGLDNAYVFNWWLANHVYYAFLNVFVQIFSLTVFACPASVLSGDCGASGVRGEDQRFDARRAQTGTRGHHHVSESSGENWLFARNRWDRGRTRTSMLTYAVWLLKFPTC